MPGIKRRLLHVEKRIITADDGPRPRWLVLHASYTDGGELYEVHSLEGLHPPRRFETLAEVDAFLRKAKRLVAE
jgi:hypothetical protein